MGLPFEHFEPYEGRGPPLPPPSGGGGRLPHLPEAAIQWRVKMENVIRYSLFAIRYSLLAIRYSLFAIRDS